MRSGNCASVRPSSYDLYASQFTKQPLVLLLLLGCVVAVVEESEAIREAERASNGRQERRIPIGADLNHIICLQKDVGLPAFENALEIHANEHFLIRANASNDVGFSRNCIAIEHAGGNYGLLQCNVLARQ